MKTEPLLCQSLTMTLPDGKVITMGRGVLIIEPRCPGGAIRDVEEAFQKLATATARVTLKPVGSSSDLDRLLKMLRLEARELLIEAEKQKPPMWAKKWKGQRS